MVRRCDRRFQTTITTLRFLGSPKSLGLTQDEALLDSDRIVAPTKRRETPDKCMADPSCVDQGRLSGSLRMSNRRDTWAKHVPQSDPGSSHEKTVLCQRKRNDH